MARLYLAAQRVPEDEIHEQVARALDVLLIPPAEWTTFPAGGYELTEPAKARLARLGLKTGWPDVLIVHDQRIHGIELKGRGGRLTHTHIMTDKRGRPRVVIGQDEMHPRLRAAGMRLAVCRSVGAVLDQLRKWDIPTREAKQ